MRTITMRLVRTYLDSPWDGAVRLVNHTRGREKLLEPCHLLVRVPTGLQVAKCCRNNVVVVVILNLYLFPFFLCFPLFPYWRIKSEATRLSSVAVTPKDRQYEVTGQKLYFRKTTFPPSSRKTMSAHMQVLFQCPDRTANKHLYF